MSCNLTVITSLTPTQVVNFVQANRLVGDDPNKSNENPILDYIGNYMKQMTGYSVTPITCVSRVGGQSSDLKLGVDCFMPVLTSQICSGNFLLQLKTCADAVCSIELSEYLRLSKEFKKSSDPEDLEFLSEELFDVMKLGSLDSEDNVISFVPFINGDSLQCFTKLEDDWSQNSQNIEYGVDAIRSKLMTLM